MTRITKRAGLAVVAAGAIALGVAAGVRASDQNTNQEPRPFSGRMGGPGGPHGMGPGSPLGMLRMLGPQLNLTDAQKEQVKTIAESHREEWKALADRERSAREALHQAIAADTMDETLVRAKSAELGVVQTDIAVASARTRAEVWQVLTPEQRTTARQAEAEMGRRGGPRGERRGGR